MPRATRSAVVGVDVGGSGIKGGPVDVVTGELAGERIRVTTPTPATPDAVAAAVAHVVAGLGVAGPFGLTLPAVVRDGIVRTAADIDPSWIGVDAVALFQAATGLAVTVLNDADAAGLAEMHY